MNDQIKIRNEHEVNKNKHAAILVGKRSFHYATNSFPYMFTYRWSNYKRTIERDSYLKERDINNRQINLFK